MIKIRIVFVKSNNPPFIHLDFFFNRERADSFATRPGQIDLSEYRHLLQPRLNDFAGIHVPVHFTVKRPVSFREKLLSIVQLLEAPVTFHPFQVQVLASELVLAIITISTIFTKCSKKKPVSHPNNTVIE